MKTYKTIKKLPLIPEWTVLTLNRWINEYWVLKEWKLRDYAVWDRVWWDQYRNVLDVALAEWWWLEELEQPSYIVTEEGEIIGEYKGDCWFVNRYFEISMSNICCYSMSKFITKEQAEAYVKREKARRELRKLYYENGYEENKGEWEVYFNKYDKRFENSEVITNTWVPHCTADFQDKMLELPRVQELYKIIFGIWH